MTSDHKKETIISFAFGAAVGAVAALLLAPKSGEELRGDITARISKRIKHVLGTRNHLKRKAKQLVASATDHIQDAVAEGEESYRKANKA